MKSANSSKKFPASKAAIKAAIARAPGKDRPPTPEETARWSTGTLVKSGGYEAVRETLAAKRKPGQRGPQAAPTKQLVSIRYSPEVLAFFKADGPGWQTRMDEALKQWISNRNKARQRAA